jgi:hypothetical protein
MGDTPTISLTGGGDWGGVHAYKSERFSNKMIEI